MKKEENVRGRARPGSAGEGDFFRIVVRPKGEFKTFRVDDVGKKGHVERLAGRRQSGSWDTQAWLIGKSDAHIEGDRLVGDTRDAKRIIATFSSNVRHVKADIFEAKDRRNVPEKEKPTASMRRARLENIKKAQRARL